MKKKLIIGVAILLSGCNGYPEQGMIVYKITQGETRCIYELDGKFTPLVYAPCGIYQVGDTFKITK